MGNYNSDDFRLSIIEPATYYSKSGTAYRAYLCQCKCGNKKIVKRSDFLNKRVRSCGCLVTDFNKTKVGNSYSKFRKSYRNNFIHNPKPEHYERIKRIWKNMKRVDVETQMLQVTEYMVAEELLSVMNGRMIL